MLIGELVPLTLAFAQQNPAADLLPALDHVLVDEYQDLNRAEQALVEKLAANASLTVIGDDCQSIYRFRYANPEGIRTFPAGHAGTVEKTILDSRRCPPNIVAMSNSLIANEPARTRPVPLTPDPAGHDARVFVVQHRTLADEVGTVADFVHRYLNDRPALPPGKAIILTPRRFIGNAIRDALIDRGRNSMSYFTEDPVKPESAARGMALLTLLDNPLDRPALRAWLGMESTTGLVPGYRRVVRAAQAAEVEPSEILRRLATGELGLPYTTALVTRWRSLTTSLEAFAGLTGLDLVRTLWPTADETCDDIRLLAEEIAVNTPDPSRILEELRQAITQPDLPDSESNVIRVMSLHKSKGLTASLVVIAGAMAGALPSIDRTLPQAEQDAQHLEQRRLFYVAITRATDTLVISAPAEVPFAEAMHAQVTVDRRRWIGGEQYAVVAMTPFVGELGPTCPRAITGDQWRARERF
jgi:superfamily I DNA/RNA helicase